MKNDIQKIVEEDESDTNSDQWGHIYEKSEPKQQNMVKQKVLEDEQIFNLEMKPK